MLSLSSRHWRLLHEFGHSFRVSMVDHLLYSPKLTTSTFRIVNVGRRFLSRTSSRSFRLFEVVIRASSIGRASCFRFIELPQRHLLRTMILNHAPGSTDQTCSRTSFQRTAQQPTSLNMNISIDLPNLHLYIMYWLLSNQPTRFILSRFPPDHSSTAPIPLTAAPISAAKRIRSTSRLIITAQRAKARPLTCGVIEGSAV